jgi:hypothetical protein
VFAGSLVGGPSDGDRFNSFYGLIYQDLFSSYTKQQPE